MGKNSKIEWTDHTWNPWIGCRKISAGCENCYMFRGQERFRNDPTIIHKTAPKTFNAPLQWAGRDGNKVFVCSWSDFFINAADDWRDDAWDIIRRTPHLLYLILTKRPGNILDRLPPDWGEGWPNVWLGVSAENQETADERIPLLLKVPAALHFVSCEPLLGPIIFPQISQRGSLAGISWCIVGGESGPDARPMRAEYVYSIKRQCQAAKVPFFFKQWGEYAPVHEVVDGWYCHAEEQGNEIRTRVSGDDLIENAWDGSLMARLGRKRAGRMLGFLEYSEFPADKHALR